MPPSIIWEYCTVEWIWSESNFRINAPDGRESRQQGSYAEVPQVLSRLGREGWEVVSCVGVSNWLFWTLKRPVR